MPDDDDDPATHFSRIRDLVGKATEHLNNASDSLDYVQSKIPTLTGGKPLPRPRPKAAPQVLSPLGGGAKESE